MTFVISHISLPHTRVGGLKGIEMNYNTIICPGCGWIGRESTLTEDGTCPNCDYSVQTKSYDRLLTLKEIAHSDVEYDGVRLDKWLASLIRTISDGLRL